MLPVSRFPAEHTERERSADCSVLCFDGWPHGVAGDLRTLGGRVIVFCALIGFISLGILGAESPPVSVAPTPTISSPTQTSAPVPPPSTPAKLSAAELEKLLMPIALYPDPLLATMLPASVYPLEIVQAARFVGDTNNLAKVDEQPWDESVKAVARIPGAIKKMNDDLQWTIQLGEAFLNQDKDVMDTIQALRSKAQKAGTLQTTSQQTVVVTNMVVETKVEQQVVVVTNTVVQIQPSNPQVVYVPSYPPTVYYPPPAYVYDPYAPLITFTAGVAMGAIIANNCDWHHGGCYWGGGDVDIDRNTNINVDRGDRTFNQGDRNRVNAKGGTQGKKWQPDSNRVRSSGSTASARSMESRGWSSGGAKTGGPRASTLQTSAGRSPGSPATRPAGGGFSTGSGGGISSRPSTPSAASRPSASPSIGGGNRPAGVSASPAASPARSGGSSAFSGGGGGSQQAFSSRGAASRGGGGFGGGGGGGRGGGGRGGGGGGRR